MKLEPLQINHAPLLVEAAHESVEEIQPWMPWCSTAFSLSEPKAWISEQIKARECGTAFEFVFISESGCYLGGGGINHIRTDHNFANIGYWIRSSKSGSGLGTQALKQLVTWARMNTEFNRLEVIVAVENIASQRVAEKADAREESVAAARLLLHGQYHDALVFSFTR